MSNNLNVFFCLQIADYLITTSIQAENEKYKDLFFQNHDTKP